jgi:tetratricopeptide (TPR) repeat protein
LSGKGLALRSLGRYEEALTSLDRAIELDPHSAWALTSRGETYRLTRRYEEALADLNHAIELSDDWAFLNRGATYLLTGRYEEALADLNRAVELYPEGAWRFYSRALAYLVLGQRDDAATDLKTAIQLAQQRYDPAEDRQDWRNTFNLAIYHLAAEETEKAKSLYQDALSSGASTHHIHEALGDLDDFLTVFPNHTQARAMRDLLQNS